MPKIESVLNLGFCPSCYSFLKGFVASEVNSFTVNLDVCFVSHALTNLDWGDSVLATQFSLMDSVTAVVSGHINRHVYPSVVLVIAVNVIDHRVAGIYSCVEKDDQAMNKIVIPTSMQV
jgi:hypothetical protein